MANWINFQSTAIGGITTGSAYSAYDAVGGSFTIPLAAGGDGGLMYDLMFVDRGTAKPALRMHMFATAFSASPNGATWELADVDEPHYLGYVDVAAGDWVTGGTAKQIANVSGKSKGIYATSAHRTVYAQLSTTSTPTWGDTANPLRLNTITVYG